SKQDDAKTPEPMYAENQSEPSLLPEQTANPNELVQTETSSAPVPLEAAPEINQQELVRELLAQLEQFDRETKRITADLRGDSLEQRIARSESELVESIRLQSRTEFLLSLN
ncbi:MAG: hypothetical protein AAGG44_15780, partial [Planctomycetota bacterium]